MNRSLLRPKNRLTLPGEIAEAAKLSPGDTLEWHVEQGEIRGRKLVPVTAAVKARLVKGPAGYLVAVRPTPITQEEVRAHLDEFP